MKNKVIDILILYDSEIRLTDQIKLNMKEGWQPLGPAQYMFSDEDNVAWMLITLVKYENEK